MALAKPHQYPAVNGNNIPCHMSSVFKCNLLRPRRINLAVPIHCFGKRRGQSFVFDLDACGDVIPLIRIFFGVGMQCSLQDQKHERYNIVHVHLPSPSDYKDRGSMNRRETRTCPKIPVQCPMYGE